MVDGFLELDFISRARMSCFEVLSVIVGQSSCKICDVRCYVQGDGMKKSELVALPACGYDQASNRS